MTKRAGILPTFLKTTVLRKPSRSCSAPAWLRRAGCSARCASVLPAPPAWSIRWSPWASSGRSMAASPGKFWWTKRRPWRFSSSSAANRKNDGEKVCFPSGADFFTVMAGVGYKKEALSGLSACRSTGKVPAEIIGSTKSSGLSVLIRALS